MARLPLVRAVLALAGGILLGLLWPVPVWGGPLLFPLALLGAAVAGAGAVAGALPGRGGGQRPEPQQAPPRPAGLVLLALFVLAGALLGATTRTAADRSCLRRIPDRLPLQFVGTLGSLSGERLGLRADSVRIGEQWLPCASMIPSSIRDAVGPLAGTAEAESGRPATGGSSAQLRVGRRIHVTGRWWSPPGEGRVVGRAGALLVDSVSPVADIDAPAAGPAEPVVARIQSAARARLEGLYGAQAPLAASLLLAQRDGLDAEVRDRYARSGLSHLLAISGLHVGLVAGLLLLATSALRLGRRSGPVAAGIGTLGYVAFLGAPHSAVRAALQVVLLLGARLLQRPTRSAALMAAAALVLLVVDPAALLAPGFQLSFAGVVGILVLRRPLLRGLRPLSSVRVLGRRPGEWLADGLATSVAATLATAPIVAWHFGQLAPIGVLANLVAIPLLGLALPALAVPLIVSPILPGVAAFLAPTGTLLLNLLDRTAAAAAAVPWGTVSMTGSVAVTWTAAVGVGWLAIRRQGRVRPLVRAITWTGVAGAALAVAPLRHAGDSIELHMIDVGQGDAIAVRSPAGRWLLVDAGIGGRDYDAGERRVVPYLSRQGALRLEALVLTHPDADHTGGAAAVIRALRPRWIGDPAIVVGKPLHLGLLESVRADALPWVALERGVSLDLDGVVIEVLYPDRRGAAVEDANDASVIIRVEYGEFSALLTGDAPAEVERRLVDLYGDRLEAEVLKVGHHGSSTSTTPELLSATGAAHALISAGRGNRYGHPHPTVVRRLQEHGVQVYRSDRHGSVIVRSGRDGRMIVETERGGAL